MENLGPNVDPVSVEPTSVATILASEGDDGEADYEEKAEADDETWKTEQAKEAVSDTVVKNEDQEEEGYLAFFLLSVKCGYQV